VISDFIVYSALILGGIYVLCWLSSSRFRKTIEAPKYRFLQQVQDHEAGKHPHTAERGQSHVRP
jgi:hypothetical protein